MKIDLSGRRVLITGATGDLGRVMAAAFAACGADVAVHSLRRPAEAEALCVTLRKTGVRAQPVAGDVTRLDEVMAMRTALADGLGAPDIVVANAVIQYAWTSVLEQNPEDYESQFRSSVLHTVHLAKAFLPEMIRRKAGRFIGINTECSLQCHPGQSAYVSGKRGMDGVMRVLAREVGPHQITVNQVAPGWMISERDRKHGSERQEAYEKNVPLRHRGLDQDVANAVVFLASNLAGFIHGAFLPVCGGNVMPAI